MTRGSLRRFGWFASVLSLSWSCARTPPRPEPDSAAETRSTLEAQPVASSGGAGAEALERECNAGSGQACISLGRMYATGDGGEVDTAKAFNLYRRACDAGFCAELAAVAAELERRCNAGSGVDCNALALSYANGEGVPVDPKKAFTLHQRACESGHAFGCTNLGSDYEKGRGVVVDAAKAVATYQRGCDGGSSMGCLDLALMFHHGKGVSVDMGRAAALYERGCNTTTEAEKGGAAMGCLNAGMMYRNGLGGLPRDDKKGTTLFQRACDANLAKGCFNLGIAYEKGLGVGVDHGRARALFQRACDGGLESACAASRSRTAE